MSNESEGNSYESLARKLIDAVSGIETEETVAGVVQVFEGIIQGMNNNWERHIAEETNEILALDNVRCPRCDRNIKIERTRSTIYTYLTDFLH